MPKEKQDYRDTLALLAGAFPDQGTISVKEAARWYGRSERTLRRDATFPVDQHGRVAIVKFARWMSG